MTNGEDAAEITQPINPEADKPKAGTVEAVHLTLQTVINNSQRELKAAKDLNQAFLGGRKRERTQSLPCSDRLQAFDGSAYQAQSRQKGRL